MLNHWLVVLIGPPSIIICLKQCPLIFSIDEFQMYIHLVHSALYQSHMRKSQVCVKHSVCCWSLCLIFHACKQVTTIIKFPLCPLFGGQSHQIYLLCLPRLNATMCKAVIRKEQCIRVLLIKFHNKINNMVELEAESVIWAHLWRSLKNICLMLSTSSISALLF